MNHLLAELKLKRVKLKIQFADEKKQWLCYCLLLQAVDD